MGRYLCTVHVGTAASVAADLAGTADERLIFAISQLYDMNDDGSSSKLFPNVPRLKQKPNPKPSLGYPLVGNMEVS